MNEEYLKGLHGHLSIKEDFGTWVSSVKDNDEYLQGLHGHLGIKSDYNTWKSSVWGSGEPQEVDTPSKPKGETAEAVGDSDSNSADLEASSSESNQDKYHPFFRTQYPDLASEADELQSVIDSRPIMADNSKELARLEEIQAISDSFSAPKRSMRQYHNDNLKEIDAEILEAEKRADRLSKNSEFSFEEILESDGSYADAKMRRDRELEYRKPYDAVLERIKEDTNSDQHDFLGKIGRVFGINAGDRQEADQTITLNDKVEEQILVNLEGDRRTFEKIGKGYATLQEKENLINQAKVQVVKREEQEILNEAENIRSTITDDTLRAEKFQELDERFNALLGEVGYDQATGMLKNNFKKTDESQEFDEMVSQDGFFPETGDAVSSFLEGVVQTGFKGTVGFTAEMMSGLGDVGTDQEGYSIFDAFADTVGQVGNYNYLPSSKKANTRLVGEDGELNLNYKTVSKSLAQTLPFTLAIINDVKRGKISNVEASLGRLLNPTKSQKMTNSLKLIDSAYRHTLVDNLNMAEELGLDDNKGRIFANTLSLAEGMAELVMPDTRFFKTTAGNTILGEFKRDLKSATTRQALQNTVKNFTKNMASELIEEELVLATEDLLKFSMIVGHENSEFWDMKRQKELAAATVIMSGALGGANVKRDFQGNIAEIYREISNDINGVSDALQEELDSGSHNEEVQTEIKNAMEWANNMNKVIKTAPENVTGEQIDLLMKKQELLTEMKSVDDAFHPQYKAKIEAINAKINPANEKQTTESKTNDSTNNSQAEAKAEQPTVQTEGEEEVAPEVKDGYKKTAEAFRNAKFYKTPSEAMSKLQSDPTGLLKFAWDGAMETMATTIETTGKIDSAIRKGVAQLKQSEWYQNLSTDGKKQAIEMFEKDSRQVLQPMADATVKPKKKTTKATVRQTTGQTDQSDKVTTTKAKVLKEKFKNLQKGSKLGAKAIKQAKSDFIKEVTKEVRQATNTNSMTKQEAARVLSAVNQLDDKNYDKVKPLVDKVIENMESRGLNNKIKTSKSKIKKAAKSNRTPVNVRELAKGAAQVDQRFLNNAEKATYDKALDNISKALKASSNKNYKMTGVGAMEETLNTLAETAEKNRIKDMATKIGLETEGLSTSEITKMIESQDVDEFIGNLKEAKAKDARLALEKQASYAAIALNDVTMGELSETERKFVRELKSADLELMSSTDIRDFIKIVDNIAMNNNFSSAYDIISKSKSYKNVKEAMSIFDKKELGFLKSDKKSAVTNFKTLSLMFKTVFKNGQKSAKFNRLSGLSNLSMGYTKARQNIDALSKKYNEVIKKVAKTKNKGIRRSENTMLRGVVGQLIQGTTAEDFSINRSRMEDHIANLKKSGGAEINRSAVKLEEVYDQFKDLNSQEEVKDYVKGLNDGNWELVDFWLKYYESKKDDLKYNTEVVHGEGFDEVSGNYLPIKLKQDGTPLPKEDGEQSFYNLNGIKGTKPSPTTIKRTKSKKLPQGRILDLDFDAVMFNRANRVEIDLNTSQQHKDVVNFFKSPQMYDIFHKEVVDAFNERINRMRDVQLGISNISSNDAIMKTASKVERTLKTLGTTMALGSVTQYPKQYVSVAVNVMARLGNNAGLMMESMFTNKSNIPLLDMVSVSMRGETQAGTITSATRISEEEKRQTMKMASHIARATGEKMSNVRDLLFTSLRKGDVNVAKSSWVAFYKEYLIKNGVNKKDIDMKTEHELMDSKLRQDAISYAELMVEETQIASDDSRGSEFYQSTDTWKSIFRGIFLPYQSFNINSKMRMITDLAILQDTNKVNTREEKVEALKSLAGTTAEVVAFQTMKIYILSQLYALGKTGIEELFDLDTPDEDDEKEADFKFKKWYSALIKDLNPLSIGAFAEDMSIEVLNFIHYLSAREDSDQDLYEFQKKLREEGDGNLFYKYGDKLGFEWNFLNDGGLYQIPSKQLAETLEDFQVTFEGETRDKYGNVQEYDFTDEQLAFMKFSFAVDLISALGLGEADTRRIINKVKREQKKLAKD